MENPAFSDGFKSSTAGPGIFPGFSPQLTAVNTLLSLGATVDRQARNLSWESMGTCQDGGHPMGCLVGGLEHYIYIYFWYIWE